MKKHFIKAIAMAALATAAAAPANADHNDRKFDVRVGQAWVTSNVEGRRYDHRRNDRAYRHWFKLRKRHYKQHERQNYAHAQWHWYNDGRWDRYYEYDHQDTHHALRYRHRDFHGDAGRHR